MHVPGGWRWLGRDVAAAAASHGAEAAWADASIGCHARIPNQSKAGNRLKSQDYIRQIGKISNLVQRNLTERVLPFSSHIASFYMPTSPRESRFGRPDKSSVCGSEPRPPQTDRRTAALA